MRRDDRSTTLVEASFRSPVGKIQVFWVESQDSMPFRILISSTKALRDFYHKTQGTTLGAVMKSL